MLTSPVWRGHTPQRIVVWAYTAGAVLGGLGAATALWVLSGFADPLPWTYAVGIFIIVLCIGVLRDLEIVRIRLPENRRLVPREVFDRHPLRAAVQFGFELGIGVRTYLSTTAPYVLAAGLVLLSPSYSAAVLVGAGFGLGRGAMALARFESRTPERWDRRLDRHLSFLQPAASLLTGLALASALIVAPLI